MSRETDADRLQARLHRLRENVKDAESILERVFVRLGHAQAQYELSLRGKARAYELKDAAWRAYKRLDGASGVSDADVNAARTKFDAAKQVFADASRDAGLAKNAADVATDKYNAAFRKHSEAKEVLETASREFSSKLQALQDKAKTTAELVELADIPHRYRQDVRVSRKDNGETHLYFGFGKGGNNHGHVVLNPNGTLKFRRNPR